MPRWTAATAGWLWVAVATAVGAQTDARLEIVGRIQGGAVSLDRTALAALPPRAVVTGTPWTNGESRFEGVLLRDLLAAVGAHGTTVRAFALNDYTATIPIAEALDYDVLVAWKQDGRVLERRDKGPFWIIYPWSQHPELDDRIHRQRAVWQLVRLVVE